MINEFIRNKKKLIVIELVLQWVALLDVENRKGFYFFGAKS